MDKEAPKNPLDRYLVVIAELCDESFYLRVKLAASISLNVVLALVIYF